MHRLTWSGVADRPLQTNAVACLIVASIGFSGCSADPEEPAEARCEVETRPQAQAFAGMPDRLLISGAWQLTPVFTQVHFTEPIGVYPVPGSTHLIVPERSGRVVVFENHADVQTSHVALDLSSQTLGFRDGGMLGLVFHPDFRTRGARHERSIFINYLHTDDPIGARDDPDIPVHYRLSRFDYDPETHTIAPDSEEVLINQRDEHNSHQGGALFFHPKDGFLYFSVGDEGSPRCGFENCQVIDKDLYSGVLRIDVDERGGDISHPIPRQPQSGETAHYYIPNDNPFVGEPGVLEEFYALGLRSPHRMTYDPVDDLAFIGEVGQNGYEELDVLAPGANYQWDVLEAFALGPSKNPPDKLWGHWTDPILAFDHNQAKSIIGGYVYRGSRNPDLQGKYIYADFVYGTVYALEYEKKEGLLTAGENPIRVVKNERLLSSEYRLQEGGITSFGHDAEGELYLSPFGKDVTLLRLDPAKETKPNAPNQLSETGLLAESSFEPGRPIAASPEFFRYEVNTPLYSDGAIKTRFAAIPSDQTVEFSRDDPWDLPIGSVFMKHFEMALDETQPQKLTRLETRVLVLNEYSSYGITYRWNEEQNDAELVYALTPWELGRTDSQGEAYTQLYTLPGTNDCPMCHTRAAGRILGFDTAQLNRPDAQGCNQIERLNAVQLFGQDPLLDLSSLDELPRLVALEDENASLEDRVRSYWAANCSMCHRPDNLLQAVWDARIQTPLEAQSVVGVTPFGGGGDEGDLLVAPGDPFRSLILKRTETTDPLLMMPPLGRSTVDQQFNSVLREWIQSLAQE